MAVMSEDEFGGAHQRQSGESVWGFAPLKAANIDRDRDPVQIQLHVYFHFLKKAA